MKIKLALALATIAFSIISVHAQNTMRSFSSTGGRCDTEVAVIDNLVANYPHPNSWTWIVACDEDAWASILVHLGVQNRHSFQVVAETDRRSHITYVRGYLITHSLAGYDATPEHTITHELCHIYLDSGDEGKVDKLAWTWIKEHKQGGNLVASK